MMYHNNYIKPKKNNHFDNIDGWKYITDKPGIGQSIDWEYKNILKSSLKNILESYFEKNIKKMIIIKLTII